MRFLAFISFLLISASAQAESLPKKITLATTDWCPYACESDDKTGPGFVAEYLGQILKTRQIDLEVKVLPWTRAIDMAKSGEMDGLLTAAASEMEGLKPTTTPTGTYRMCFYSNKASKWQFKGASSFGGRKFGIIADYSYGEPMDSFIKDKANAGNLVIKHGKADLLTLLEMVKVGRIDATLDDRNVIEHETKAHGFKLSELSMAGCMEESPYFVALSPKREWASALIEILNQELGKKSNKALYQKLLDRYTR